ncbi:DNA methyltransferase [Pseudomonas frederiksbergensis]|uniref:DNA methyltransferase n=1 Tax=Pseudomonas frederiksbergensis TaxID=104087 RepID=UPI000A9AEB19|nr:DNA methyltransferase [Pseudomonas frederiksbergensis]
MGSGSTGKAAMREGFQFIGCEIDEQYAAIARARIEHEVSRQQEQKVETDQLDLFGTA